MPATVNLKSTNLGSPLNVVLDSLTPWAICHTVLIRGLTTIQRSQTVIDITKYSLRRGCLRYGDPGWSVVTRTQQYIRRHHGASLQFRHWQEVTAHCWMVRGDWSTKMRIILSSEFSRSLSVCTPSLNSLSIPAYRSFQMLVYLWTLPITVFCYDHPYIDTLQVTSGFCNWVCTF